ncbi:chemotaxis protein CheD [Halorussus lipolyticus]|uniref:chemotaxis protein CheD n=1 Tax=Halorussus lipolyticus TaxID=3034024 RepID=UPI0023E8F51F|nr:chemotaxis protein CheD [Halorussus sp. DT80]
MTTEHQSPTDDNPGRVRVGVAELAVASGDTRLTTSGLGSCVGIAVADPPSGIAGLAHVMLPEATSDAEAKPAKSMARGVEGLVAEVEDAGGDADRLEAKIAGGSRMFDFSGVSEGVGQRNVERARETLADCDVPVVAEDVGGDHGRSLELVPETWTLTVTSAHRGVENL